MHAFPTGTVTFLFTDLEGSTQLLNFLGDRYARLLADHHSIVRAAIQRWNGQEIDTQGDAFFVAFARAKDAISAAVDIQVSMTRHEWPRDVGVLVRMGLHTGEPTLTDSGYVGIDVHRAARICAAGFGGQVLLSAATQVITGNSLPDGASIRDLGEYRLKDLQRPEHIYQLIVPGLPPEFPPLKSLDAQPNNLPIQMTSFIGREREISQVKQLLDSSRLVTLMGPGGAGKTRLSLQAGANELDRFPDGVWLVELASLADGAYIPKAIANVLKVREDTHRALMETLSDELHTRSLLLIIDNCEHLIEAAARTVDALLQACLHLKIIATSREILNIPGEVIFMVPSLSLPSEREVPEPKSLTQYEAARLFVDRATACQADFSVTRQNAGAIARICAHLDGIPLAIELAAARVRTLTVEQIAERLDNRFPLLTGGSRTKQPRQQTLEAAIDWSYDLLQEDERMLFRRLSVFVGGWTLETAEQVCVDELLPMDRILELLTHLVDKSMVVFERQDSTARYRYLETIRQYAENKLQVSGEADRIHDAHFRAFYQFTLNAEPKIRSNEQIECLNSLELEHDNLRTALGWAFEQNRTEEAAELIAALTWFWALRSYMRDGRQWGEKAVATTRDRSHRAQGRAKFALGFSKWRANDYLRAQALFEQSCEHFQVEGDRAGWADALHMLGHAVVDQGHHDKAREIFTRSSALYRELNDQFGVMILVGDLGLIAYLNNEFDQADVFYHEQLRLSRASGYMDSRVTALNYLGDLARCAGDDDQAETFYRECWTVAQEVGYTNMLASLNHNLAHTAKNRGDHSTALRLFCESMMMFQTSDDQKGVVECLEGIAEAAVEMGKAEQAARLLGAAEALRASGQVQWWPANRMAYEKGLASLRQNLDSASLNAAWVEGSTLTLEQAVEFALSIE